MNVTELARILKVTPNDLKEKLPRMGFDIGYRAIKVDPKTAQMIIRDWPFLLRKLQTEDAEKTKAQREEMIAEGVVKKVIPIPSIMTVRDFAALTHLPVNKVLAELMKNGVFSSMNERIDFDTASIIGQSLGIEVSLDETQGQAAQAAVGDKKIEEILAREKEGNLIIRPPVIVVMGHVDHGKTKLLDTIRKTNVAGGEHGGITQHIGAYQVVKNNRLITFIDTPGHEAFTAMRSRGARIADVAILVVAADDGVQPQTIEAYKIIQAAQLPFIIAINKIDKAGVDLTKIKQEMVNKLGILPDDWGGKVVCAPISALKGTGIEELLDLILLTADSEAKSMRANPQAAALGTVIESHIDKNSGPLATILIQNGTLRVGDQLILHGNIYGKARALKNYKGENVKEALPSMPVMILGLKMAPAVGDVLEVGEGERIKGKIEKVAQNRSAIQMKNENEDAVDVKRLNLIIKSDVLGSAEAIEESLMKINTEEVKVKILNKSLGNIIEGDIARAEGSNAEIVGFNVKISPTIEVLIREKGIKVHAFNIIYDLIDYVQAEMKKLVVAKIQRVDLGRVKVLKIFRTENKSQIVGGKVLDGQAKNNVHVEILRNKVMVAQGKITKLQAGKMDMPSVDINQECGMQYEGKPVIQEGDILQFFEEKEIAAKL
ncbi:MAG: translation initiation factor IF-2 [Patescibacteria group bacterium]|nr:translation initiation factor IF-2 [Patescibacteria group bacterium]